MTSPVLLGFDATASAAHAIKSVRAMLSTSHAIVATIYEPALVAMGGFDANLGGGPTMEMDVETAQIVERANEDHAQRVGDEGAALARAAGFTTVEVEAIRDERNVAETLAQLAADRGAAAIVIGSHGHGALRTHLLGSTGTKLLQCAHCPVIVVPQQTG